MADEMPIPKIERTTDYKQFKLMKGNRVITRSQVSRLRDEMEQNPHLLAANPILVNEHMFIIDGQHRYTAAQELGAPLYYMIVNNLRVQDARHLNVTQRAWGVMDFARSYADSSVEAYKTFLEFSARYPELNPSIIMRALAGSEWGELSKKFRKGQFFIDDIDGATDECEKLVQVIHKTKVAMTGTLYAAFHRLLKGINGADEFVFERFMSKLESETARERLLSYGTTVNSALRAIENAYNFQSPAPKRIY